MRKNAGIRTNAISFWKVFPVLVFGSHFLNLKTRQMNVKPFTMKIGMVRMGFIFLFFDLKVSYSADAIKAINDGASPYHINAKAESNVVEKRIKKVLVWFIFLV